MSRAFSHYSATSIDDKAVGLNLCKISSERWNLILVILITFNKSRAVLILCGVLQRELRLWIAHSRSFRRTLVCALREPRLNWRRVRIPSRYIQQLTPSWAKIQIRPRISQIDGFILRCANATSMQRTALSPPCRTTGIPMKASHFRNHGTKRLLLVRAVMVRRKKPRSRVPASWLKRRCASNRSTHKHFASLG